MLLKPFGRTANALIDFSLVARDIVRWFYVIFESQLCCMDFSQIHKFKSLLFKIQFRLCRTIDIWREKKKQQEPTLLRFYNDFSFAYRTNDNEILEKCIFEFFRRHCVWVECCAYHLVPTVHSHYSLRVITPIYSMLRYDVLHTVTMVHTTVRVSHSHFIQCWRDEADCLLTRSLSVPKKNCIFRTQFSSQIMFLE